MVIAVNKYIFIKQHNVDVFASNLQIYFNNNNSKKNITAVTVETN